MSFRFTADSARKLAALTARNIGRPARRLSAGAKLEIEAVAS